MANQIFYMNLLEKNDKYVIYEFGDADVQDGRMKLSIENPKDYEILQPSEIGEMDTLLVFSKLARLMMKGEIPERTQRFH
jgi:hypothetical protein